MQTASANSGAVRRQITASAAGIRTSYQLCRSHIFKPAVSAPATAFSAPSPSVWIVKQRTVGRKPFIANALFGSSTKTAETGFYKYSVKVCGLVAGHSAAWHALRALARGINHYYWCSCGGRVQ